MKLQLDEWQKEILDTKGNIALRSGRQVGKSTVVAIKAAEYAFKHRNKVVMVVASVERQAQLLFEKILAYMIDNHKSSILMGKDRPTKSLMKLKNGSRIYSLPTGLSGHGIRGYTVDLLIVDEAAFVPEAVFDAITPMLAITRGDVWLLSTPFGRQGYFYNAFSKKSYSKFHISGEDCPRADPEYLKEQKQTMSKVVYAQEVLGEFIDELMQYFPTELIEKCMTVDPQKPPKPKGRTYLGADIARLGADETIICSIANNSLRNAVMFDMSILMHSTIPQTYRMIKHKDQLYDYRKLYIDTGGVGGGVYDLLIEDYQTRRKAESIDNAKKSLDHEDKHRIRLFKEDLYANLLSLMQNGRIALFRSPEVLQSLKSVQYEYSDGGRVRIFGNYTHIAEALIRAAWGLKDKSLNIWVR